MRDLIIGVVKGYDWDKVAVWALSIATSGYQGLAAVIMYDDNPELEAKLKNIGIQVIRMELKGPIFHQRFYDICNVLRDNRGHFDHVIATDVRDVFFQGDPSEWLRENLKGGIYAASEGMLYKDEPWGRSNLSQSFGAHGTSVMENPIYNAGVISGKAKDIQDLFFNIYATSVVANPPVGGGGPDQAAYNVLLATEGYKATVHYGEHEDGYAAQLGTTADPHKIAEFRPHLLTPEPIIEDGVVKTSTGTPYRIVHQYDRAPVWEHAMIANLNEKLAAAQSAQSGE